MEAYLTSECMSLSMNLIDVNGVGRSRSKVQNSSAGRVHFFNLDLNLAADQPSPYSQDQAQFTGNSRATAHYYEHQTHKLTVLHTISMYYIAKLLSDSDKNGQNNKDNQ